MHDIRLSALNSPQYLYTNNAQQDYSSRAAITKPIGKKFLDSVPSGRLTKIGSWKTGTRSSVKPHFLIGFGSKGEDVHLLHTRFKDFYFVFETSFDIDLDRNFLIYVVTGKNYLSLESRFS